MRRALALRRRVVAGGARPATTPLLAALAAVLLLMAGSPARAAVDPFYNSRLLDGIAAAERGAHQDAVRSFRIACFGMLDEEPQLADCLVRLALAQAGAGDREGFAQTFQRLVEGEELIGLYTKTGLGSELVTRFETKVVEWVPRAAIAASAAFGRLVVDQREAQLAALAPKARRERLLKLEKEEPKAARWPLLLARFEKEQKEPRAALAAAGRALAIDPNLDEARCLRGWAHAGLRKYADAADDLAGCHTPDPAFVAAELQSRVELEQWGEAEGLLARMTVEQKQYPGVADLAKRVERALARQAPPPPRSGATPPTEREAAAVATGAPRTSEPRRDGDGTGAQQTPAPAAGGTNHRDSGGSGASPPASKPAASAASAGGATTAPAPAATRPAPAALPGGPPGGALPSADETTLARAQSLLARARNAAEIEEAYGVATELAARYPSHPRVQHTTAEIAYRASRWSDAVRYFRRGGDPGEAQPLLLFYFAVALWESGNRQEAQAVMRRCDGKLRPTPFVQAYRSKILGTAAGS